MDKVEFFYIGMIAILIIAFFFISKLPAPEPEPAGYWRCDLWEEKESGSSVSRADIKFLETFPKYFGWEYLWEALNSTEERRYDIQWDGVNSWHVRSCSMQGTDLCTQTQPTKFFTGENCTEWVRVYEEVPK
jgi:hypothetical protein